MSCPTFRPFKSSTSLAATFAKGTWRAEQSIIDLIQNHLDANKHTLPQVQLLLVKGNVCRWVNHSKAYDASVDEVVFGIRIHDNGGGYDRKNLSLIGASDKGADERGGFGEGLKIATLALLRQGAKMRMISKTTEGVWIAIPEIENGILNFTGQEQTRSIATKLNGSITEVVWPKECPSLDPRKDSLLKRHVLEFDPALAPFARGNYVLPTAGVKSGAVFVKGIFIEEDLKLLRSYNFQEKRIISGRDRKKVDEATLVENLVPLLSKITDEDLVGKICENLYVSERTLETVAIQKDTLIIPKENKPMWKSAILRTSRTTNPVFCNADVSPQTQTRLQELRFQIVKLPSNSDAVLRFIERIWDGPVTVRTLRDAGVLDKTEIKLKTVESISPKQSALIEEMVSQYLSLLKQAEPNTYRQIREKLRSKGAEVRVIAGSDEVGTAFTGGKSTLTIGIEAINSKNFNASLFIALTKLTAEEPELSYHGQSIIDALLTTRIFLEAQRARVTLPQQLDYPFRTEEPKVYNLTLNQQRAITSELILGRKSFAVNSYVTAKMPAGTDRPPPRVHAGGFCHPGP